MSTARVVLIDGKDGRLVADFIGDDIVVFHVRAIRFLEDAFARYHALFDSILADFRNLGYKAVYAAPFADNAWSISLVRSFGFTEWRRTTRGLVIMKREI